MATITEGAATGGDCHKDNNNSNNSSDRTRWPGSSFWGIPVCVKGIVEAGPENTEVGYIGDSRPETHFECSELFFDIHLIDSSLSVLHFK